MVDAVGGCVWSAEETRDESGPFAGSSAAAGAIASPPPVLAPLDTFGPAPELTGNTATPSGLSGRVDPQDGSAAVALTRGPASVQLSAVGLAGDSAALDGTVMLHNEGGTLDAGVRHIVAGNLSGTTLARVGYQSAENASGPVSGSFHAALGVVSLPDLRRRLSPSELDSLGYSTTSSDSSLTAAVVAFGADAELRPLRLAEGVHLDGQVAADGVLVAPVERDPRTAARISDANNGFTSFDEGASLGLSRLAVSARAGVNVEEGPIRARVEASVHSNVMDDPTFALKSGGPLAALADYAFSERALDAALETSDGAWSLRGHLPLASTRGDEPALALEARLRAISARVALELGERPVLGVSAAMAVSPGATVGLQAQTDFHGSASAQATLRISFGGSGPRLPEPLPDPQRPSAPPPSRDNRVLPPGVAGMTFEQTMDALDTPEKVSAYLDTANREAGALAYLPHNDDWSKWTPRQTFEHGGGICADLHLFGAAALQHHGVEAYDVQFMARTLAHDVVAYRDPAGGWDVLQYGQIFETQAADPIAAVQRLFPDAMQFQVVDPRTMQTVAGGKASWAAPITDYFGASTSRR